MSRPRYRDGEQHTLLLQVCYDEIAVAQPPRLIDIAARAEATRVTARLSGDHALEETATAIRERAERRLNALRRNAAQADSPAK